MKKVFHIRWVWFICSITFALIFAIIIYNLLISPYFRSPEKQHYVFLHKPFVFNPINIDAYYEATTIPKQKILDLLSIDDIQMTSISYMLHYVQFWGCVELLSDNQESHNFEKLILILLKNEKNPWFPKHEELFYLSGDGIVRTARQDNSNPFSNLTHGTLGEAHPDQVLSTLGSIGIESDQVISFGSHENYSVSDNGSLDTFRYSNEMEFSLMAFLYYLPPTKQWQNRWGDVFSFDSAADYLLNDPLGYGTCSGIHRLIVFASMLRVNENFLILSPETTKRIEEYLLRASCILEQTQSPNGAWTYSWHDETQSLEQNEKSFSDLHITGHHLEWIIICPKKCRPSEQSVVQAILWCQNEVNKMSLSSVRRNICEHMHVLKVLFQILNNPAFSG